MSGPATGLLTSMDRLRRREPEHDEGSGWLVPSLSMDVPQLQLTVERFASVSWGEVN